MSRRELDPYLASRSMTQVVVRAMLSIIAAAGLWASCIRGDLRWEILFGVTVVCQNVDYAANKILFYVSKSR